MSQACSSKLVRAIAGLLAALLVNAGALWACSLPMDPYVVALPDSVTINGTSYDIDQFHGWVKNTPDGDNDQQWSGYLCVPAGAQVSWRIYWDPSVGGTEPNSAASLGLPAAAATKQQFEILRGAAPGNNPPAVKVDLYDLTMAAALANSSFKKPMKVQEIYARVPGTGGWNGTPPSGGVPNYKRVSAPWVIPNPANGALDMLTDANGQPFNPALTPTNVGSKVSELRGWGQDPNGTSWLSNMFGAAPGYAGPYATSGRQPGAGGGQFEWVIDPASIQWTSEGGLWTFKKVEGRWKLNVKNTGKTSSNAVDVQGLTVDWTFDTPSEPFFYLVRPIGEFTFNLSTNNSEWFQWTENKVVYDPTGNPTATPIPSLDQPQSRTVKFQANGDFKKGSTGPTGGVPTLVMVQDTAAPLHVHMDNQGAAGFTGGLGGKLTGSAKFTVVDNNPYAGYSGTLPQYEPRGGSPPLKFNPSNAKADFYYSMPVNDFARGDLTQVKPAPDGDFALDQSGALNTFPFLKERWKWFKGAAPITGTWKGPFVDGQGAPGPDPTPGTIYGNGQNPSFTTGEFTCDASLIKPSMAIHHMPGVAPVSNPDGSALLDWQKRLKFFIVPTDASNNLSPLNAQNAGFTSADDTGANWPTPLGAKSATAEKPMPSGEPYIAGDSDVQVKGAPLPINWQPAIPGCAHDKQKLGTMGFMDGFTDAVRPSVVVLVKDTKYDRTYIVNDQQQGWWNHPTAKAAVSSGNATAVDDAAPAPWTNIFNDDGSEKDTDTITFGTPAGGADAAAFAAQVANGWTAYTPPSTRNGIYVDEDTRLVFQVLAWENVNWQTPIANDRIHWKVKDAASNVSPDPDESSLPDLASGKHKFEYVFRDPNFDGGGSNGKECSVTIRVDKPNNSLTNGRQVVINFYVASNKLKILTLEEKRGNK